MTNTELLGKVVTELVDSHRALRIALTDFAKLGPVAAKLEAAVDAYRKKTTALSYAARCNAG